ncbi:MAG: efflux RND transporter periplasmic adaptor subunit, partial [Mesorhizobium sp.]
MHIQPNRSLSLARPRRLSAWAGTLCAALLLAACSQEKSQVPASMGGAGRPEVGVVTLH